MNAMQIKMNVPFSERNSFVLTHIIVDCLHMQIKHLIYQVYKLEDNFISIL